MIRMSASGPSGTFCRMDAKNLLAAFDVQDWVRSPDGRNDPDEQRKGSRTSRRVGWQPRMITPSLASNPSISTKAGLRVCSQLVHCPRHSPAPRARHGVNLVDKHDAGRQNFFLACSNMSAHGMSRQYRQTFATKSEPENGEKGTPASPRSHAPQKRLTGTRGPTQQRAFGYSTTKGG